MYNPEDENEPPESAALPPERAVAEFRRRYRVLRRQAGLDRP
jgi:hypothetical protein